MTTSIALGEAFEFIRNGMNVKQSKDAGGLPITRIETISDGSIDFKRMGYAGLSENDAGKYILSPGDILLSHINSVEHIGKCALFESRDEKVVHGMNLLAMRPRCDILLPRYAMWALKHPDFKNRLLKFVNKAVNQASISTTNLKTVEIPLPPLEEQRRIAGILDQAAALCRLRSRALDKLNTLGQAIFHEMFGDLRANPFEWPRIRTLGEVADVASGITKGRKAKADAMREIPYLAVSNVQEGYLKMDVVKMIEATEAEIKRFLLKKGDLLLTEGGDPDKLGRGTLWNNELPECIHQNHVFRVRATCEDIRPIFLSWQLGSAAGKAYFLKLAKQTTGIASINKTQLKNFPVLEPPIEIQKDFEARLATLATQAAHLGNAAYRSQSLFASLQHRAFRGEL